MKTFKPATALLLTGVFSIGLYAQTESDGPTPPALATGNPRPSYALSGIDNINYFNGSLNISIPLLTVGGRGDATRSLVVPLQVQWIVDPSTLAPLQDVSTAPGLNGYVGYSLGGYIGLQSAFTAYQQNPCTSGLFNGQYEPSGNVLSWMVWNAPDGTQTALADEASNGVVQQGSCNPYDRGRVFHSYDGSSLTFVSGSDLYDGPNNQFTGTLYFPNGTQYKIDGGTTGQFVSRILDRNGNQITEQWNGYQSGTCSNGYVPGGIYNLQDSAGRTVTVNYTTNPACNPSDKIIYAGSQASGTNRTITVNYGLLASHMIPGLPLGSQPQTSQCLFPELNGSSSTTWNGYVVSSISLPDGSSYSFLYDYYGEVAQMTLPTSGVIAYKWPYPTSCTYTGTNPNNPTGSGVYLWNSGTAATIIRRVQERDEYANGLSGGITGKAIYQYSSESQPDSNHQNRSSGTGTQTIVTFEDLNGNLLRKETHLFYGDPTNSESVPSNPTTYPAWSDGLEFQTIVADSSGVRQSQQKLWQQQPCVLSNCWFTPSQDNSARMNNPDLCQVNTTLDGLVTSATVTFYDDAFNATNNVIEKDEYNFGSAPTVGASCPTSTVSGFLRQTTYSYLYASNATYGPPNAAALTNVNLVTLPSQKTAAGNDGSTAIDKFLYDQAATSAVNGEPGHDDTDFGTGFNFRGNLTSHQSYDNFANSYPAETFAWDMTGLLTTYTDFNSNVTSYAYTDQSHVLPTSITNALNQKPILFTYDQNILQLVTLTDQNGIPSQYSYLGDPRDRLTSVARAAGISGVESDATYSYPSTTQVTIHQDQNSTHNLELRTDLMYDGFGRQTQTVVFESPSNASSCLTSGVSCITTTTTYDTLGRVTQTSNPARSGDTLYYTAYAYDGLNRVIDVQSTFDSAQNQTSYSGNLATVVDAAGNTKKLQVDAAGRLIQVTEDPNGFGYVTSYLYDVLDDLKQVSQGSQTRTLTFDSRGRLRTAVNPESNTTQYSYDNNSNLTARRDNQGVVTSYQYDQLNRLTQVSYSGARTAPPVTYAYDTGVANSAGHLVSVTSSSATEQIAGYDALGRITGSIETIGGVPYTFGYTYNFADALLSETYPTMRVINNAYDGANRLNGLTATPSGGSAKTYLSNVTYSAFGGFSALNYGSCSPACSRIFSYNGRMQLGEMKDQGSSLFDLKYYYGGAATSGAPGSSRQYNNGNPTGVVETAQKNNGTQYTFTQTYGYDTLNRLNAASDTGGWTQNFCYDRYGNLWTSSDIGLPSDFIPRPGTCSPSTAQYTSSNQFPNPSLYDGYVGNQTVIGTSQLTYDAENRVVQEYQNPSLGGAGGTINYTYDGLGLRVSKTESNGTTILFVYDVFGSLAVEYQSGTISQPACLTCYLTWDHLGSVRMVSDTTSNGFTGFHDYAPFGAEVLDNARPTTDWGTIQNGPDNLSQRYTGAEQDAETLLNFLQARYLGSQQARFMTPDPTGNQVADPTSPQSWNMYSYAWNNPLVYFDPSGLCSIKPGSTAATDDPGEPCVAPGNTSVTVNGGSGGYLSTWIDPCFVQYYGPCPGQYQGATFSVAPPPPLPTLNRAPNNAYTNDVAKKLQQNCLDNFNNSGGGAVVNFFSLTSPFIGPDRLQSAIEDVGGTGAKFAAYSFFKTASKTMVRTPFGSMSGLVAGTIETVAKDVVAPVAAVSTAVQVGVHLGCYLAFN
jgi:RHS repeat-associated protein